MSDLIKYEQRGSVALLTMDNPAANVWTLESLNRLRDLVQQLDADASIRALVPLPRGTIQTSS